MEFDQGRPIFQQLARELCRRIIRGQISPGGRLPTVKELALEVGVNPNTVQRACQELEREGIVVSRRGAGIFATDREELRESLRLQMAQEAVDVCLAELGALGFGPEATRERFLARLFEESESEGER